MRYYFDEAGCDTIGERYQYGLRHFRSKLGGFLLPWFSAAVVISAAGYVLDRVVGKSCF